MVSTQGDKYCKSGNMCQDFCRTLEHKRARCSEPLSLRGDRTSERGKQSCSLQYNTIQYNTLFNHATFRSEKRSLKHVRALRVFCRKRLLRRLRATFTRHLSLARVTPCLLASYCLTSFTCMRQNTLHKITKFIIQESNNNKP